MTPLDKRQKRILLAAAGIVLGLILLLPRLSRGEREPDASLVGVIPEAEPASEEPTRTASYRRGGDIGAYWDSLEEEGGSVPSPAGEPPERGRAPQQMQVEDLFGDCKDAPAAETPPPPARKTRPATKAAPPGPAKDSLAAEPPPPAEEPASAEKAPRQPIKRSGAVSSLAEDVATELGNGFSTLDGTDRWIGAESGKPYRCMFTRDEKVRSGQRITVRVLEDLVIGGVHIPRNTHLQGVVNVTDRLEVRITSLDMGGRILSFHFEAYDTDGGKGIYCSDINKPAKAAAEQGLSTVSSTLSSRLGRVARDAASVGASIIRNKAGEATVSVPAGYTFYILEETR